MNFVNYNNFLDLEKKHSLYTKIPDWSFFRHIVYEYINSNKSSIGRSIFQFSYIFSLFISVINLIPFPVRNKIVYFGNPRQIGSRSFDENLSTLNCINCKFKYIDKSKYINRHNFILEELPLIIQIIINYFIANTYKKK